MSDAGGPGDDPPDLPPLKYARVPLAMRAPFLEAEGLVERYFADSGVDPQRGRIAYGGQRYILMRANSMALEFVESVQRSHDALLGGAAAARAARSVLYDVAHAAGCADAESFHAHTGLDDPVERLSTGPTHFAFTGWGVVLVEPESAPSADDDYLLVYDHDSSFEASAWLEAGRRSDEPVCAMNAGYSAGWCQRSFGLEQLHAVEVLCKARGDACCRFVMAPPGRIAARVQAYQALRPELELVQPSTPVRERYLDQLARAYREVEASERLYRTLFTDTQDAVLVSTPAGALEKANQAGLKFLELDQQALEAGVTLRDLVLEPPHDKLVARVLAEGSYRGDVRFRAPAGETRVGLASVSAGLAGSGHELRWIVHDITQRLRYEERLRERQHLESLGSLSAGIAHDFNNLLAATLNSAALLERGLAPDDPLLDAARTIRAAAERGRDLTRRLLSYGRGGRYEVHPTSLNAVVEAVIGLLQPTLEPRIELVTRLDPDLPAVSADRAQLESALLNVCLNARDAMPGGGTLRITTGHSTASSALQLADPKPIPSDEVEVFATVAVADDGEGMPPEVVRRAREPFFTTKPRGHGTGLGLAMVEGVVRNHHGFLELSSTPGAGTLVTISLPALELSAHALREDPVTTPTHAVRAAHVLVVDDTEPVAVSTGKLLEATGHRATLAHSGERALELVRGGLDCDVVLLDLLLPGMDGHQTLIAMRELRPALPVIVFSGYAQQDQVVSLTQEGVSFLPKPFEVDDLLERIRAALR